MRYRLKEVLYSAIILSISASSHGFASEQASSKEPAAKSAEGVVRHLYDLVTFKAGNPPDWNYVKTLFIEQAVAVLRTGPDETTVFSLDGWVQDFVDFIANANLANVGFTERIVRLKPVVMGDMAQILVLYESIVPGSPRGPRPGVDSFVLIRQEGGWKIVAIANEIPTTERPVPEVLRQ